MTKTKTITHYGTPGRLTPVEDQEYFRSDPHFTSRITADVETKYTISTEPATIDYKYNEGDSLKEIQSYIDATYEQHYSRNKFQATEFIIDAGHGTGFNIGNMMKYTQRYGRKGDPAEWRKDLMKVIHYAIMQLHVHDTENKD
jgi:membrane-anchored protein YejM (alkaline phosphatase superfamily)